MLAPSSRTLEKRPLPLDVAAPPNDTPSHLPVRLIVPPSAGMTDTALIVTGVLTALAATAAALFAGLAIRAQDRAQRRQQALENFRWLNSSWDALRPQRARAARALQNDRESVTDVREVLNFLENVGYLARRRYLDLETAEAVLAATTLGWWAMGQSVVAQGRAEFGSSIFEDLEWLHAQLRLAVPQREGWHHGFLSREAATQGGESAGAHTPSVGS